MYYNIKKTNGNYEFEIEINENIEIEEIFEKILNDYIKIKESLKGIIKIETIERNDEKGNEKILINEIINE